MLLGLGVPSAVNSASTSVRRETVNGLTVYPEYRAVAGCPRSADRMFCATTGVYFRSAPPELEPGVAAMSPSAQTFSYWR